MVRFGLWYDFRNPPQWRRPLTEVYAETLEQIAWAEGLGYEFAWTTEHHFVEDDYSPSLLPICAAIAVRTTRLRVGTSVLLLPMHDPVRVAEDAATVDVISGGRLDLGVGLGYRVAEFAGMGIVPGGRGKRMDEALAVLTRAWSLGAFSFAGQFHHYEAIDVTPKPVQRPMPLWIGGLSPAAVRRAVRFGTGFMAGAGPDRIGEYVDGCRATGKPPGSISKGTPFVAVATDPDAAWATLGPHLHYQRSLYARWLAEAGSAIWALPDTPAAIRAAEPEIVVTPARARTLIAAMLAAHPEISHLYFAPIPPGLPPAAAAESLRLFAEQVAPHFAAHDPAAATVSAGH